MIPAFRSPRRALARVISPALAIGLTALVAGACGTGGGTSTFLTPGKPTSAAPGPNVLYAALAVGDRVVAYRLGEDGLLPREPFSSIELENPRRVLLGDGVLYVALRDGVAALTLGPDGALPAAVSSQTTPTRNASAVELLLRDDVLYVAFENLLRVQAFQLENGQLPPEPLSSSGTALSSYRSLAEGSGFLYAGAFSGARIDTYIIQPDGSLPEEPEPQQPETTIFRPEDMLVAGGRLYAITQSRERIEAFTIRENGLPSSEFESRTASVDRYARILLVGDRLYATAFNRGTIDMYVLEPDGSLPLAQPDARTAADAAAFPAGLVVDDGILYVAQSGLDRIDAYILNADGSPAEFPSSSTDPIDGGSPTDIAIGTFPLP